MWDDDRTHLSFRGECFKCGIEGNTRTLHFNTSRFGYSYAQCINSQLCQERQEPKDMSAVKWCDLGQHPFPANQAGATTMTFGQQVSNQWGGTQPANVAADVCAACALDSGMPNFTDMKMDKEAQAVQMELARNIRDGKPTRIFKRAAITSGETKAEKIEKYKARQADPDYIKFLELMDDNGLTIEEVAERLTGDRDDR